MKMMGMVFTAGNFLSLIPHLLKRQQQLLVDRLEGVGDGCHAPWGTEEPPHTCPRFLLSCLQQVWAC